MQALSRGEHTGLAGQVRVREEGWHGGGVGGWQFVNQRRAGLMKQKISEWVCAEGGLGVVAARSKVWPTAL